MWTRHLFQTSLSSISCVAVGIGLLVLRSTHCPVLVVTFRCRARLILQIIGALDIIESIVPRYSIEVLYRGKVLSRLDMNLKQRTTPFTPVLIIIRFRLVYLLYLNQTIRFLICLCLLGALYCQILSKHGTRGVSECDCV